MFDAHQTEANSHGLFDFTGRIGRGRYWATWAIIVLVVLVGRGAIAFARSDVGHGFDAVSLILVIALYVMATWIGLATCSKRLHDIDSSGWLGLLTLIPIIGLLMFLHMGMEEGRPGPNRYGAPPQ